MGTWEQRKLGAVAEYRNGKAHENEIDDDGEYIVVNSKFVSTNGEIRKFSSAQNEPFWHEIFFHSQDEQVFDDVTTCILWIYERLQYGNKQFPGFFSLHSFGFMREERTDGKKRMIQTWGHIINGLCDVLKNDSKIRPNVFDQQFTEKQFADILFSLILVSMIRQDYNPSSILMLINKTLY